MNPDIDVFVFTRFGVDVEDAAWFDYRFKVFESVTLPSLKGQEYKNFVWYIFLGQSPFDWVVDRIEKYGVQMAGRIVPVYDSLPVNELQNSDVIRSLIDSRGKKYCLLARIDDDDAWAPWVLGDLINRCQAEAASGVNNLGITYEFGVEWLYCDLLDITKLQQNGARIIRKAGAYPYHCAYHSMSSFLFTNESDLVDVFLRLHGTRGSILSDNEVKSVVIRGASPAWLYFRHHQTNSSTHKAHKHLPLELTTEKLCSMFSLNLEKVEYLVRNADTFKYAKKSRRHGDSDKNNILIDIV